MQLNLRKCYVMERVQSEERSGWTRKMGDEETSYKLAGNILVIIHYMDKNTIGEIKVKITTPSLDTKFKMLQ